jgi:hypothetical protein
MVSEETRIGEWRGNPYTFVRKGCGRPPSYCSDACRHEAENAIAAGWMRRKRWRDAGHTDGHPPINPRGRPPKG